MAKGAVRARIRELGIIPAVRVSSAKQARYAAEAVNRAGIPIAEITMTVPGALEVISDLLESLPEMIVGAGTILDLETAARSVDAGATFLTSVEFARAERHTGYSWPFNTERGPSARGKQRGRKSAFMSLRAGSSHESRRPVAPPGVASGILGRQG